MYDFPYKTPALPVQQPFGTYWVTVLPADLLLQVAFSDLARVQDADSSGYRLAGTQRKQHRDRSKEIGEFIDTTEAVFPTSIVLAANYRQDGVLDEGSTRWTIEDDGSPHLVIPSPAQLASVVDGQHRLWAFKHSINTARRSMPLVCSVFLDLPNPYQAYLFATVNFNQKKVDRSLAYELFGFDTEDDPPKAWTPEKTAVFLTRRLNMEDQSPLRGRIVVAAQDNKDLTKGNQLVDWSVSTATVVDGLLRLFSRKPKRDRSAMFKKPRTKRARSDLPDDGTPARELYRRTNDKAIYALASNFLSAANATFWQSPKKHSSLIRTVGIQALFDIMSLRAEAAIKAKNLGTRHFTDPMRQAATIDFTDDFFQASGKGRTRIKNVLALAMNLTTLEDVPEGDRTKYADLIRKDEVAGL